MGDESGVEPIHSPTESQSLDSSGTPQQSEEGLTNSTESQQKKFGLVDLLSTLLDVKTLPHLVLLLISAISLYWFAGLSDTSRGFAAAGFIAMTAGYCLTAFSCRWNFAHNLVRMNQINPASKMQSILINSLKSWIIPIASSGLFFAVIIYSSRNFEGIFSWLTVILASLFILWSIGQGLSFKTGATSWLSNQEKANDITRRKASIIGPISTQLIVVFITSILIGYGYSRGFHDGLLNHLDWIGYIIASLAVQIGLIYLIKPTLLELNSTVGGRRFSFTWGAISQIFVTWHLASAWRRLIGETESISMMIEELVLMVMTVLMAIWALSSRNVARGGKLFTSDNALFWALAFGYGYAGSIAMMTTLGDFSSGGNIQTTMAIGHLITALTILLIYQRTLSTHNIQIHSTQQNPQDAQSSPAEESSPESHNSQEAHSSRAEESSSVTESSPESHNAPPTQSSPAEESLPEAEGTEQKKSESIDEKTPEIGGLDAGGENLPEDSNVEEENPPEESNDDDSEYDEGDEAAFKEDDGSVFGENNETARDAFKSASKESFIELEVIDIEDDDDDDVELVD